MEKSARQKNYLFGDGSKDLIQTDEIVKTDVKRENLQFRLSIFWGWETNNFGK